MAYCTVTDLQRAMPGQTLIWLSNDDPAATAINATVVNDAIAYAAREINRKISGRYELPLQDATDALVDIAVAIARHYLYARRPEGQELPEAVTRTYGNALKTLTDIRDGKENLDIAATSAVNIGESPIRTNARTRLFGGDTLGQY
ncbi:MAG: hypothetical protein RI964_811 [Pseudomonadota bacterium]|jgi:phage gp36-like protein